MTTDSAQTQPWQSAADVRLVQRRTLRVLFVGQVLGGIGVGIGISVAPIIAEEITGSESLAGLARTLSTLGAAFFALPLALLAARRGRRIGLGLGWFGTAAGSALLVAAVAETSLALLLPGMLLIGIGSATSLQARYAATDVAEPGARARALATVLWASTVGTVLGPNMSGPGTWVADRLDLPPAAGGFVIAVVVLTLGAVLVTVGLQPDPLLTARSQQPAVAASGVRTPLRERLVALAEVVSSRPHARFAFIAIVTAQTVMVAVMTMTPVHMHHDGHSLELIGITISAHVLGMFAFSPLVGWLADRYGRVLVIASAPAVFWLAAGFAGLFPSSMTLVTLGLFLLGLAWSLALVAGSTLLTESVPAEHTTAVQGAADTVMYLAAAVAAAVSGPVQEHLGFPGLNAVAAVLVIPAALMVMTRRHHLFG